MALGIERGDRAGMWSPNRAEWVYIQYATAKIGAIQVNWSAPSTSTPTTRPTSSAAPRRCPSTPSAPVPPNSIPTPTPTPATDGS